MIGIITLGFDKLLSESQQRDGQDNTEVISLLLVLTDISSVCRSYHFLFLRRLSQRLRLSTALPCKAHAES